MKHEGSCLCGEVRFEVDGAFERFFLCHCSRCRKDSGSAHGANLFSSTAKIRWLSGEAHVRSFRVPGTRHEKSFCARCGSALPRVQMNGALLVVPAGSLDSTIGTRPDAHIFVASRARWDDRLEDVPRADELPGRGTGVAAKPRMQKTKQKKSGVEGEGSYTASRRYRAGLEKSVAKGDSAKLARKAQKAYDGPEGDELRRAEATAKKKAQKPAAKAKPKARGRAPA